MKIILILLLLLPIKSFAIEAVVIVLETPLFISKSKKSKIIQYVRKGDKIYIHNKDVSKGPNEIDYEILDEDNYFPVTIKDAGNGFYETLDRNGQRAFILADHIKILYKDSREFLTKITRWDHDPTDYRLEEPLPERYPIYPPNKYRSLFLFAFGPQRKVNYPYRGTIRGEDFDTMKGFNFHYMKKVEFDPYDRFYFGFSLGYNKAASQFNLSDNFSTHESTTQILAGPYFSYDAYRRGDVILTFAGGISFTYTKMSVLAQDSSNNAEERKFSSLSLTPRLGSYVQLKKYLPLTDIIIGGELLGNHPLTLTGAEPRSDISIWNPAEDRIYLEPGAQFSLFIGAQAAIE